ncbi:MAG: DNA polymerase III subunit alpha [bacterium]
MAVDFTHLHVHTQFSLLDGLSKDEDLAAACKAYGMDSIAITDHGNMYGAVHFYNHIKKAGLKPIIGVELYYTTGPRTERSREFKTHHILLLAKNFQGYQNLMKMVSIANLEGFYYKPRVDWEILVKYHEGLIATTSCAQGEVPWLLRHGEQEKAEARLRAQQELFGDDLYIELQRHDGLEDMLTPLNEQLVALSRKFGIPLVATNDIHYVKKEDARAQDALLSIGTRTTLDDANRFTMINSPTYYLKSKEEMADLFADLPEAISNTRKIVDKCNVVIPQGKMIYPQYPVPEGLTPETYLHQMVYDKLPPRYPVVTQVIKDRIEYELDVICSKGYASYFLIVQDFINWAKSNGIRIGPGRGSAAGSIVSFILRITTIDPFAHGLQFERFLNPQRPSPPDIDVDISDIGRGRVIEYVTQKYGVDKVAQVITFGTMESRSAIRDIGRVLGMPYSDPDLCAKLIPLGSSIDEALKTVFELQELYKNPKYKELLDLAKKVEGVARHASVHAAAVIISPEPIQNYTPVQYGSDGAGITTQYDMYAIDLNVKDDAIGLMKMDFLGLRNLSILQNAIHIVKEQSNIDIDISDLPLDDKKVFEILAKGETTGVFQLESPGMRRLAKQLHADVFSDIVALIALYRPGPMALIPDFVKGKLEPSSVHYLHPDLKPILGETYGVVVYQEQVLKIANVMAGYSLGEADILRRAMGKKSVETMNKEHVKFIAQAGEKGYAKDLAEKVWSFIEKFAGYGFNKAHATGYAMISYQTAYMKAHFPAEYMTALMSAEAGKEDKMALGLEECRNMGIVVLPPDINKSMSDFTIEKNGKSLEHKAIRFGFAAIKNVGTAAIDNILIERTGGGEYKSFTNFISRVDTQKANKKVLESLIKVGAFDAYGKRAVILDEIETVRAKAGKSSAEKNADQGGLFDSISEEIDLITDNFTSKKDEFSARELMEMERELLGIYLRENPAQKEMKKLRTEWMTKIESLDEKKGLKTTIMGIIKTVKIVLTKKNNSEMAFFTLQDETGEVECVIFPKGFAESKDKLIANSLVTVKAKVEEREEKMSLLVDELNPVIQSTEPVGATLRATRESSSSTPTIIVPHGTTKAELFALNKLLQDNKGADEVTLIFQNGAGERELKLPYGIALTPDLKSEIDDLLAKPNLN